MHGCVGKPICCPPQCCVRDFYTQRVIPVIHPVVTINRQNIVDVPQHFIQPITRNVTVDRGFQANPGYPGFLGNQGFAGYTNRLFF